MFPADLDGKTAEWIAHELFGYNELDGAAGFERADATSFTWRDARYATAWRVTHGFLVSLHEVGTRAHAAAFAARNRIHLLSDGGIFHRETAEVCLRATLPLPAEVKGLDDLFQVHLPGGVSAVLGYASLMFTRLVLRPAAEEYSQMPDPSTVPTLVINGIDREDVSNTAEQVLYHLRREFAEATFLPARVPDLMMPPEAPAQLPKPARVVSSLRTSRPEAVAFYNRASESEPVLGFLYYYRVLEACFDDVLSFELSSWRRDPGITELDLLRNVRRLTQKEDLWSLRQVLGQVVNQVLLDQAHKHHLIDQASADALRDAIYNRRNSIAHGRRGQHARVLVPFCVASKDTQHDRLWWELMGKLASSALAKWILLE